eukprot:783931_1
MSQHFKSNTDLSNNSNFDDAIGGMHDLSHQESNATDESSTSILLPNNMGNITLMGLNHLQSSPLQQFVNPNINAPKLVIPPSKVQLPPDITPGNKRKNDYNKPPEVQIQMEENDDSKNDNDSNNIPHPI